MRLLLILILLVSCSSVSSQYPRKAIIDGDTVAILSIGQIRDINVRYVEYDKVSDINKELNKQLDLYRLSIESLNTQIYNDSLTRINMIREVDIYKSNYEDMKVKYDKYRKNAYIIGGVTICLSFLSILNLIL